VNVEDLMNEEFEIDSKEIEILKQIEEKEEK